MNGSMEIRTSFNLLFFPENYLIRQVFFFVFRNRYPLLRKAEDVLLLDNGLRATGNSVQYTTFQVGLCL